MLLDVNKLHDIVESDETFFLESLKGKKKKVKDSMVLQRNNWATTYFGIVPGAPQEA